MNRNDGRNFHIVEGKIEIRKEIKPACWWECEHDVIWSNQLGLGVVDDVRAEDERSGVLGDCSIIIPALDLLSILFCKVEINCLI